MDDRDNVLEKFGKEGKLFLTYSVFTLRKS